MKNHAKGFSLIELNLSLFIFAVVAMLVLQSFTIGFRSSDEIHTRTRITGEIRSGIERIERELRNSAYARVTVLQPNQLQFTVPQNITSEGVITWGSAIQYILGGVNGQQLLRQDVGAGTSTVIANNITGLQFVKNANPATLSVSMTGQGRTAQGRAIPVSLNATVEFRN